MPRRWAWRVKPAAIALLVPALILQASPAGVPLDIVSNLTAFAALLVAIGLGWVVPGWVLKAEQERSNRADVQAEKMMEILKDIVDRMERADEREKLRREYERGNPSGGSP